MCDSVRLLFFFFFLQGGETRGKTLLTEVSK